MMRLFSTIDGFFFRRISARMFSAMRIAWAFFTGAFLLMQWKDVTYYYSGAGIYPAELYSVYNRQGWRFSVLDYISDPHAVFIVYLILLIALFLMMIGWRPRIMTIISVLLLYSFHERNVMVLAGGDTLLRNIGFILMISPGIGGFSVTRLKKQWKNWRTKRKLLPVLTMPIWGWRLLLWQMIAIYATSFWYKSMGTMWWRGTAVEAVLHNPTFARFPDLMYLLTPYTGGGDYLALVWQISWLLLLVPRALTNRLPRIVPRIPLRRILIIAGIIFHGGILVLMDAGVFSLAVFTAYIGLLRDDDVSWMKRLVARVTGFRLYDGGMAVLYDGNCGLCLRSIFALQLLDWLGQLRYVNFRDIAQRKREAPDVSISTLDKAMHIRLPDGKYLTGFDAFRHMAWHLPVLWIVAPFLYIPGIPPIGRRIYARIADNRKKCDHESCGI